jgi:hypothetical protein
VPAREGPTIDADEVRGAVAHDPVRADVVEALLAIADAPSLEQAHAQARRAARDLALSATAEAREADEDDALSQAASLLQWGAQKLPELAELDVSDLLMAKVIADIRATHDEVERIVVDHRRLLPIHPIDRATAEEKAEARATAARQALPLLEEHGMQLTEALIAAHDELSAFKSVTGFQVVEVSPEGHYVTFEGNGRREALLRAFPDTPVQVEVRCYRFTDPRRRTTIQRRLERVRRWKGIS